MTETRITDEKTGGQKGQKPEQLSLLPIEALQAVSRVYAFGAEKYERHNWRLGYQWHLSYDAMQRHIMAFWSGEDLDPESGEPHLAHAIFHAMTLMTFMDTHPDGDDRYRPPSGDTLYGQPHDPVPLAERPLQLRIPYRPPLADANL